MIIVGNRLAIQPPLHTTAKVGKHYKGRQHWQSTPATTQWYSRVISSKSLSFCHLWWILTGIAIAPASDKQLLFSHWWRALPALSQGYHFIIKFFYIAIWQLTAVPLPVANSDSITILPASNKQLPFRYWWQALPASSHRYHFVIKFLSIPI